MALIVERRGLVCRVFRTMPAGFGGITWLPGDSMAVSGCWTWVKKGVYSSYTRMYKITEFGELFVEIVLSE